MALLEPVVNALERSRPEEETFDYQCVNCGAEFELAKTRMVVARCPSCESTNVRDASELE